MRFKMLAVASIVSTLALAAGTHQDDQAVPGQGDPRMTSQERRTTATGQEGQIVPDQSTIRAYVNLVSTPVVVHNAKGELVINLSEKDLRVFDNGVQQTLETFELDRSPLSLAIVVETSSRIAALLPMLRRTGLFFTHSVLGESGEAAVISYNDEVAKLLDFTNDDNAIEKGFDDLQAGTSGAYLYDALSSAVDMLRNLPPSRRRVIVTLAEARDTGSERKLEEVLQEARFSNIAIYSIGLSTMVADWHAPPQEATSLRATPPGTYGLPPIPGSMYTPTVEQIRGGNLDLGKLVRPLWDVVNWKFPMQAAAASTGGLYQSTGQGTSVEVAIDRIGEELRSQYILSYRRAGGNRPGFHQIKVEVVGQRILKARSRSGYYLLPR